VIVSGVSVAAVADGGSTTSAGPVCGRGVSVSFEGMSQYSAAIAHNTITPIATVGADTPSRFFSVMEAFRSPCRAGQVELHTDSRLISTILSERSSKCLLCATASSRRGPTGRCGARAATHFGEQHGICKGKPSTKLTSARLVVRHLPPILRPANSLVRSRFATTSESTLSSWAASSR